MSFNASDKRVYELLNDKEYIIPINQRKYVWNKNNWSELLEDLILVLDRKKPDHFVGSIVLKREQRENGIRNRFSIIDGQQRISTFTILLCSIGFIFIENNRNDLFNGLTKPLFVNDDKNNPHPIVSYNANKSISKLVKELFQYGQEHFDSSLRLVEITEFIADKKIKKDVSDCFIFFYREINKRFGSDFSSVEKLRAIIDEVRYIDIVAEDDEDAYTIFEILNARGQSLTDFELLCNFLLSRFDDDKKEYVKNALDEISHLLGSHTDLFLKHYITHKFGKKPDANDNSPYKIISKYAKTANVENVLNDIILKSRYYHRIIYFENCSAFEKKVFSFFKPRRQQQFRPVVLGLMHQKDLGNLTNDEYENQLSFLYEFFICYHVIGEQTSNKIEDIVYGYSEKIENAFSPNVLGKFRKSIVDRIPSEKAFKNSIKNIKFSNHWKAYSDNKKRENVRAIFEVIEKELGYEGDFDEFSIEHCLPDYDDEKNSEIGNLMLLEKQLNDYCGSKDLEEKSKYYEQSKLNCPAEVSKSIEAGEKFDIDIRSDRIANILYNYITKAKD